LAKLDDIEDDGLTSTEREVVAARLESLTWAQVGEKLGFTRQAAHYHGSKPHVVAAVRMHQQEVIEAARIRIADGFRIGLTALVEIAEDRDHPKRVEAAKHLVSMVQAPKVEHAGSIDTSPAVVVTIAQDIASQVLSDEDEE
jgi:hypothetical protein